MKRTSKILLTLVMAVVTVAGTSCAGKENTIKKETAQELKGNITIISDSRDLEALKYAAQSFTAVNHNVNISIKSEDKLNTGESLADTEGLPDIMVLENEYSKHFINSNPGKLMDLSEVLNSARQKYPKWELSNLSSGGITYGCPWYTMPVALYYRTDIFSSEGINPEDIKTWDDFIEAGKKIEKDTNKKVLPALSGTQYPLYKMLFMQLNNELIDKDGKPIFDSDKAAASINLVKRLQQSGFLNQYSSESSLDTDIINGSIACFVASADGAETLVSKAPKQKNLWNLIMLPAFEPGGNRTISLGGSSFFVSSSTKNKALDMEFITYAAENIELSSNEIEKRGIFPANEILYDLDSFNVADPYFHNTNIHQLLSSIERLSPEIYYSDNYGIINSLVENTINDVMKKDGDINPPLQELQTDIESNVK